MALKDHNIKKFQAIGCHNCKLPSTFQSRVGLRHLLKTYVKYAENLSECIGHTEMYNIYKRIKSKKHMKKIHLILLNSPILVFSRFYVRPYISLMKCIAII